MTTLFACSKATWQGSILWALNGIGLGVMVPNAQSLIADYYDATHRGRAFGMLLAVGELRQLLGASRCNADRLVKMTSFAVAS
jgi:MFS family permease